MGHPAGLRAGTRYAFSRNFREKGMIRLSTYLKQYKYVGDRVLGDVQLKGHG
jgi:large subunit ribosomal protein L21e